MHVITYCSSLATASLSPDPPLASLTAGPGECLAPWQRVPATPAEHSLHRGWRFFLINLQPAHGDGYQLILVPNILHFPSLAISLGCVISSSSS